MTPAERKETIINRLLVQGASPDEALAAAQGIEDFIVGGPSKIFIGHAPHQTGDADDDR